MWYINPHYLFDDRVVLKHHGQFSDVPHSVCKKKVIDFNKWINNIIVCNIKDVDKGSVFDPIIISEENCVPFAYLPDDACSY